MKNRAMYVLVAVCTVISIVSLVLVGTTASAQDKGPALEPMQRIVGIRADGLSSLLNGDPDMEKKNEFRRHAIPMLLDKGWKIDSIEVLAEQEPDGEDLVALVIMTK